MRTSAIGDSVEGNALKLQCRKFSLQGPIRSRHTNGLVYTFKLNIHGFATITKELVETSTKISDKSLMKEGDEIHGETINGFSSKAPGRETVDHATSTHKATFVSTRGPSFATVEIGIRDQLQAIQKRIEYKK
jgi:hypothetical protein